jgi:sugar O-acyltransferase (sialic acid O-acetyltransferase NeuD family)
MKKTDLIILGSGNPDIIKLIDDINDNKMTYNLLGFLEKDEKLFGNKLMGYEVVGDDDLLKTEYKNCAVINNIAGSPQLRSQVSNKFIVEYNLKNFPSLIHPSVNTKYFNYGIGNIIYDNVSLGGDVTIGDFNVIFYGSIVAHQTKIGNFNVIGGNVIIGSRSNISDRVIVSNSATISNKIIICDDAFVGVGSVVIKSILKPKKVFGNPAREVPS